MNMTMGDVPSVPDRPGRWRYRDCRDAIHVAEVARSPDGTLLADHAGRLHPVGSFVFRVWLGPADCGPIPGPEGECREFNGALAGTGLRVDPDRAGTFLVTLAGIAPAELPRLLDVLPILVGQTPRARPWRGKPWLTWDDYNQGLGMEGRDPAPDRSPEDRP